MGDDAYEREASDEEIVRMRSVVAASIRGGALGFSTDRAGFHLGDGGRPVPSIVASQEETEALMRVAGEIGQGVVHVAAGEDYTWLYDFQRSLGRPLNWSAILTYSPEWASRAPYQEKIERHEAGRREGADVWVQVTCRPIVQQIVMREPSPFYSLPAFAELVATPRHERHRLYADSVWRDKVYAQFESHDWVNPGWPTFRIAESAKHPELVGRSVAEISAERGVTPFDVVCDVALADDLETRFDVTFANDDEVGIRRLLNGDGCILGLSDAGAHVGQICDAVMPTDFLSGWVRDREVMTIEEGIRKVSSEIANVLEIDRGTLREGAPADLVVLDWDRLSPGPIRRVYDMPAQGDRLVADAPIGLDHVLVNGVAIRSDGQPVSVAPEARPGVVLRSGRSRR
jgi:N-acyl-D-aspartate/D-glutamate deacylase